MIIESANQRVRPLGEGMLREVELGKFTGRPLEKAAQSVFRTSRRLLENGQIVADFCPGGLPPAALNG
jgi:hypothetical protein